MDRKLVVSLEPINRLTSAIFSHMKAAHQQLLRNAEGDDTPDAYGAHLTNIRSSLSG